MSRLIAARNKVAGVSRRQVFASLYIRNYRVYFIGQAISRMGTWMQRFAQSWLVYELSHNATIVGVTVALQALPSLLVGPYGGVVADRFDKRRIMVFLQAIMAVLAGVLGLLTVMNAVRLWQVLVLALVLGVTEAFENPPRQVFVFEMVGADHLSNAVGLNSVLNSIARATGPAIGAGVVATAGLGICFLFNAFSFIAVIASLLLIDQARLRPARLTPRARGQLRDGIAYVTRTPNLWVPLLMMTLIGMLAWEFQTVLPAMASESLHGGPSAYGFLIAAQGCGSILGGLSVAASRKTGSKLLVSQAIGFGVGMALAASAPNLGIALLFMFFVGIASTSFSATGNSTIQLNSDRSMRGRVMSLWMVAFQGSTPIGGPLAGFVAHTAGPRSALAMGAAACFAAALLGATVLGRRSARAAPVGVGDAVDEPDADEAVAADDDRS